MANHKSAKKKARSSLRKRGYNRTTKGKVKILEKSLRASVASKDKNKSAETLKQLVVQLDRAARKGCYKLNKSARKKSRMSHLVQSL